MARLVGESFEDYLVSQIQVRQNLAGSGFNQSKRTPEQISVLSNRNAWLKLASSVRVETIISLVVKSDISLEFEKLILSETTISVLEISIPSFSFS